MGRATLCHTNRLNYQDYFNPRPPWGGRLTTTTHQAPTPYFNPRPPWGGRRQTQIITTNKSVISIHALRGEGDAFILTHNHTITHFNPRPPWGGRRYFFIARFIIASISIHALRGEGDCKNIQICNAMLVHSAYKTVYFCGSCAFYLT